jgi:hypothetical protein
MANIGDIYFAFRGDGARLKADAKKEGEAAGDVAGKGFVGRMKKALSGGELKKGLLAGLGFAGGLGAVDAVSRALSGVVDGIRDSIDAASDQREALALSTQVFGEQADEMEHWADTASESFGESKTAATNFAAGFGNVLKSATDDMGELAEMSQTLTERAADLGSAFNASGEEVATAIKSGLVGESEPLRRFGILLSEAAVNAEAMAMGISDGRRPLTESEKVLARYNIILKQSADSAGMFGRDSESLADTQKTLSAQMEDLSAEIGEALLPFMVTLGQTLRDDVIPLVREFVGAVKETDNPLGSLIDGLAAFDRESQYVLDDLYDMISIWDGWTPAVEDAAREQAELAETAREGGRGIGVLEASVVEATPDIETFREKVRLARVGIDRLTDSLRENAETLLGQATTAMNSYYDILDERVRRNAIETEMAEIRKAIATGKATADQKERYRELQRELDELLAATASRGEATIDEANDAIRTWLKRSSQATGQAKRDADAMVRYWMRVKLAILQASGALDNFGDKVQGSGYSGYRATGGVTNRSVPYVVGERGPELFTPNVTGRIANMAEIRAALSGVGGSQPAGGNTYQVNLTGLPQVRSPRDIVDSLRMAGEMGHLAEGW